ncbi:helix-turn-helix domain-containing protein, partial [Streptomyces sp. NPDC006129]|uniref:helix-turn-helix domain-containing protein n=1 Tax=Streptomyces sp. NPDC006129 TaxID=3155348 RepID=UPI0033B98C63
MAQVRPMRADARRNHERLLKVAVEAFAEHGESASLDDIAKRAGVGSGTLYRHFPTRQALLEAAYLDRIEALVARADTLAAERPPGAADGTAQRRHPSRRRQGAAPHCRDARRSVGVR